MSEEPRIHEILGLDEKEFLTKSLSYAHYILFTIASSESKYDASKKIKEFFESGDDIEREVKYVSLVNLIVTLDERTIMETLGALLNTLLQAGGIKAVHEALKMVSKDINLKVLSLKEEDENNKEE